MKNVNKQKNKLKKEVEQIKKQMRQKPPRLTARGLSILIMNLYEG